jgi:hypothetical protein
MTQHIALLCNQSLREMHVESTWELLSIKNLLSRNEFTPESCLYLLYFLFVILFIKSKCFDCGNTHMTFYQFWWEVDIWKLLKGDKKVIWLWISLKLLIISPFNDRILYLFDRSLCSLASKLIFKFGLIFSYIKLSIIKQCVVSSIISVSFMKFILINIFLVLLYIVYDHTEIMTE